MEYPPQPGEVWINIHTSHKANIEAVEDVKGANGNKVVVYNYLSEGHIENGRCDLPTFQAHWKRHKSASKWFLGAFGCQRLLPRPAIMPATPTTTASVAFVL